MIHFRIAAVPPLTGFSMANMKEGQFGWVLTKAAVNSSQPEFYLYIEQISNIFLGRIAVSPDSVIRFVIVIHSDQTADLYINDFATAVEIMLKRDVVAGEGISLQDIADVKGMRFPDIAIKETDKIICCFKLGWHFGLFFDLSPMSQKDIASMELTLGSLYRYLSFKYLYEALEAPVQNESMISDGWFPFIEIIGKEYKELASVYQDRFDFENRISKIMAGFDKDRIDKIVSKWWRKPVYKDKQDILQAGINAFLANTNDGNINCLKNLLSEVEGVLRIQYHIDTSAASARAVILIEHLIQKGREKKIADDSLLLPEKFLSYLKDVIFQNFDLAAGQLPLSRNTTGHGVANTDSYTRIRALQAILVLDQINYYI